ncbi:MAG: hypothetical protein AAGF12_07830 [Myxococcota bacterium]
MTSFELGINLPWVTCGHDFGPRPPAWGGDVGPRDWDETKRQLEELRRLGLTFTRIWVLAGGINYPAGENPDVLGEFVSVGDGSLHAVADAVGIGDVARRIVRSSRFKTLRLHEGARPPRLPERFAEDLVGLLEACRQTGVRLVPSLLSFEFFQPAVHVGKGIVKRGRKALVFGNHGAESLVDPFLDATLAPLLDASKEVPDAIYAWEVINEPEWCVRGGPVQIDREFLPSLHWVDPGEMSALIEAALDRIVAAGFLSTVGFESADLDWMAPSLQEKLRRWAADGQYLHQRHHYPTVLTHHRLPTEGSLALRPCMLGEFPTSMGGSGLDNIRWRDPELEASEADPSRYLRSRIELIRDRGYPSALLWSGNSGDPRRAWGAEQKRQVEAFCRGR